MDESIESLNKELEQIELVPEEELKNMDFYQLAYYMQTLNTLDEVNDDEEGE